jgi:hypothetical protein
VPDTIKRQTNPKLGKKKMAQRKETKDKIKVRDLKPKKDAKGGVAIARPGRGDAPVSNRAPARGHNVNIHI